MPPGMNNPAAPLLLSPGDRNMLTKWAHSATAPHRVVTRAKALLMAGEGVANTRIAATLGIGRPTVAELARAVPHRWPIRWVRCAPAAAANPRSPPTRCRPPCMPRRTRRRRVPPTGVAARWPRRPASAARPSSASGTHTACSRTASRLQVVERPGVRREADRRRRAVPEPAGQGGGAVRGREEPDSGPRPHTAGPADEAGPARHHDPRLQAAWHDYCCAINKH